MLPPPAQGSLPAGWLAFAGRGSNSPDRVERFQSVLTSSSFPGLTRSQAGPIHGQADELGAAPLVGALLGQELAGVRLGAPGGLVGVRGRVGLGQGWSGDQSCGEKTSNNVGLDHGFLLGFELFFAAV